MKKIIFNFMLALILGSLLLGGTLLSNTFVNSVSLDLTDEKIYTLSEGSQEVAGNIKAPITLRLFFSQSSSVGMTAIRDYKGRVESLLKEYVKLGDGKIRLQVIDTVPFSDSEDQAASFGLTVATNGSDEDAIYFGLAASNISDTMTIGFFDPSKEAFLEYDISSLLHTLNNPDPIRLTIVTDLQVAGGENPLTGVKTPSFVLYQRLQEMFNVSVISSSDESLPTDTQLLMLWHPQNIREPLLLSIDQFLMRKGKALALLDAHYESDPMAQMGSVGVNTSSLPILASYGIKFDGKRVVLDASSGLEVRNPDGGVSRHYGFLGLTRQRINTSDITSADLDIINGASFGTLGLDTNSQLTQSVLLSSSPTNDLIDAASYMATRNPTKFTENFTANDKPLTLAARYTGRASSHFAGKPASFTMENVVLETASFTMAIIADADIAADRFWVQKSSFFDETVATPFANNADFILNTLENLSGSDGLIGIRSRGTFARPFLKVQAIQIRAEERYKKQEQRLRNELEQTEAQLAQLQSSGDSLALTPQQQSTINDFTRQRASIRKSLRDVQFQLKRDIDKLGNFIKFTNIVITPLLAVLLLFAMALIFRKRAPKMSDKQRV